MGHNVSKKKSRTTEINSISIKQSLASGDVEIAEHGTLSGNPEHRKSQWRSDLSASIRRSLKPSARIRTRSKPPIRNGSLSAVEDSDGRVYGLEGPDQTSTPVSEVDSSGVRHEPFALEDEPARSSTRRKHGPYRSDSVLSMVTSKPNVQTRQQSERSNSNKPYRSDSVLSIAKPVVEDRETNENLRNAAPRCDRVLSNKGSKIGRREAPEERASRLRRSDSASLAPQSNTLVGEDQEPSDERCNRPKRTDSFLSILKSKPIIKQREPTEKSANGLCRSKSLFTTSTQRPDVKQRDQSANRIDGLHRTDSTLSTPPQRSVVKQNGSRYASKGVQRRESTSAMFSTKPAGNLAPPVGDNVLSAETSRPGIIQGHQPAEEQPSFRAEDVFVTDISDAGIPDVGDATDDDGKGFQRFQKERSERRRSRKSLLDQPTDGSSSNDSWSSNSRVERARKATEENGNHCDSLSEPRTESVLVSSRKLYNILNDGGPDALRDSDPGYLLLLDARESEDFDLTHIIGAKQISLNRSDFGVELSVNYKWVVLYDEDGQSRFVSQSCLTAAMDRLTYLGHKAKILEGGFQDFIMKYPYMCQTDEKFLPNSVLHYPTEVISNRLYLGCAKHATNETVLGDMGIVYVLNIGGKIIKPVTRTGRVMNIEFKEDSKNDLIQVMPQVISVITSALEEKGAKILVTCVNGNNKSVAVVALYLMYRKKWTLDKAVRLLRTARGAVRLSPGILEQLQRCEKLVSRAY